MGICSSKKPKKDKENTCEDVYDKSILLIPESKYLIDEEYILTRKVLGEGSFGKVIKAYHKGSNNFQAIKIIRKDLFDENKKNEIFHEIKILRLLDHPNIVKINEYFQNNDEIFIVMKYISGVELFDKIIEWGNLNEKLASQWFKKLVLTIKYAHDRKIIHRDLKPENILYDGEQLTLIDFGISVYHSDKKKYLTECSGSPYYIAPEVINKKYSFSADIWSLGVILFVILTGKLPFNGINVNEIFKNILNRKINIDNSQYKNLSKLAKDLLDKILVVNPDNRISIENILKHSFLINTENLSEKTQHFTLTNLKKFNFGNKLKISLLNLYSRIYLKNDQVDKLTKEFTALDKNGNGKLSKSELIEGCKNTLKGKDLIEFVHFIESSKDEEINYSSFITASIDKLILFDKIKIKHFFDKIDFDKSGKINLSELRLILEDSLNPDDDVYITSLLKEFDKDHDNEIDFTEFLEGLSNLKK